MARVVIPGFRKIEVSGSGEGGTTNYNDLTNKPSINNVSLVGNLKTVDLKLTDKTLTEEGVPAEAKTVGEKLEEHSTSLTALSGQLGNHTVKSDVPENAVFTDTVYDDTEVKESIDELNSNLDKYVLNSDDKSIGGSGQTNYLNIDFSNYDNGIYYIYGKSTDNKILATAHVAVEDFVVSIIDRSNHSIVANGSTLTFYTTSWWIDVYVKKINVANGYIGSNIAGINESLSVIGKCKNLLNPTLQTTTLNGVTCTNNGDGTYTLNGTASENAEFVIYGSSNLVELNKEFRLTGCPKNTDAYLIVGDWGNPWTVYGEDRGSGSNFTITTSSPDKRVLISVPKGAIVDNVVFKPMITTNLNATYDDFVPYIGDSGKLNSDVASLLKRIETLESIVNKTDTTTVETE